MTSPPSSGEEGGITLAAVKGAHGITGEVRLKLFGEGLDELRSHKVLTAHTDGSTLTVKKLRDDGKGGAIARFDEIGDRTAAERLRGNRLSVPRETLPPLAEGEFYHRDLIGLAVVSDAGDPVGTVCALDNFGATDIVEIEKPDGKKFMVPLTNTAVPEWNDKRLIVSADFIEG
ncbi:Ribosome maturation factor RimM [Alteripontixanthobacter maritimus]|uniref:Ribosome maturation factor RimM n=1 Tax=Alteripontixanthobacter maritimus TaxID=2161824 RepID=A0A369Q5K5_9SPHN|nr:ribosome maturation factor RimM [Alteripontixanthobacter maritimus]RDC60173.1 Ribosome maturation factor RimM [Alteripontixanthobacter maritimus]